jgi:hypothetical protein
MIDQITGKFRNIAILPIIIRVFLLISSGILSLFSLVYPQPTRPAFFPIKIGDVASQDIQAPYSHSFTSEILTNQSRDDAEKKILPIYLPADTSITRRQIERLRLSLAYVNSIRTDAFSNLDQKIIDLAAMTDIKIKRDIAEKIIDLNDPRWQLVQQESLQILEQVMRNTIRVDQLREYQENIPTLISYSIPQEQALIIVSLTEPFIVANSLFSPELTETSQKEARNSVQPTIRNFMPGEIIVRRGQIITPVVFEALQEFDLIQPEDNFRESIGNIVFVTVLTSFTGLYFYRRRGTLTLNLRSLVLIAITFLIFLFGARVIIPNRAILPYLYPIPAFGLTIASVFNLEISLILSLILSLLASYNLSNSLELTLFYGLSSMVGILILGKGLRISNFFWSG